ncbi:pyruvate:ferredoxin (flavodoxin) oxidoreductase, partial [human gut metagenome]
VEQMKKFIVKSYGKKGEDVVNKNYAAVDRGGEYKQLTVDPAWANLADNAKAENNDLHSSTKWFVLSTHKTVTYCRYLHSRVSKTVLGNKVLPNMRNVV